MTLGNS